MKRKKLTAALLAICAAAFAFAAGCSPKDSGEAAAGTLTLYTWSDMFPAEVLDGFTRDTGIKIEYRTFPDEDEDLMFAGLSGNGASGCDIIIADDYMLEQIIAAGLAQKLDRSKIPNILNVNPLYQGQFYDPDDEYVIPYGAGVQTLIYDPAKVTFDIKGFADLWNPELRDAVGIIGNPRVINGMALKVLSSGNSYNIEYLAKIDEAGEKLLELAPNIRIIKDSNLEEYIISGEVIAAVGYTSNITLAHLARPDLKVVYPSEGVAFGIMGALIPADAANADAAHRFLEYILDPARGARCFELLCYYSTFRASDSYIEDEMKPLLTLPENFHLGEMIQTIGEKAVEEHQKVWEAFVEATGQEGMG